MKCRVSKQFGVAEQQSWEEASDGAGEIIRDPGMMGNKDGRAKDDPWVSSTAGNGQRCSLSQTSRNSVWAIKCLGCL